MKFIDGFKSQNWKYSWDQWDDYALEIDIEEPLTIRIPDSSSNQIKEDWDTEMMKHLDNSKIDALVGPIRVNGLRKGDAIKIEILDIRPGKFGWSAILDNFGLLKNVFQQKLVIWDISGDYATGRNGFLNGLRVPIHPMIGILGTSPASGEFPVIPPQYFGGNMDNRYIKKGAVVYLPVNRDGVYFAMSDPHASQGNGEVCGTGIETSAEVVLKVSRSSLKLQYPIIESYRDQKEEVVAFTGIDRDLYNASQKAVNNFISYAKNLGITGEEAYILASVAGDLEISEIVDEPNFEVSLVVPRNLLLFHKG